jgi:hypothetical protein
LKKHKPFENVVFECFTTNFKADKRGISDAKQGFPHAFFSPEVI